MPSSNILLFDANKANMMSDEQYNTNTQRLNGVQSGIASSQLQNKTLYQVSLVAYAIAQIMNQNGLDANDTAAVSAFVANLSGTMLQKVADLASTQEAQAGVATGKWMSPALVKAAIDTLAAKAQNILSDETKTAFGLGSTAVPDDVLAILSKAAILVDGNLELPNGSHVPQVKIETGSYEGTGTGGAKNPNNLTFGVSPVIVIVGNQSGLQPSGYSGCWANSFIYTFGEKSVEVLDVDADYKGTVYFTQEGTSLSWYSGLGSSKPGTQCNNKGSKYNYVAIGLAGGAT